MIRYRSIQQQHPDISLTRAAAAEDDGSIWRHRSFLVTGRLSCRRQSAVSWGPWTRTGCWRRSPPRWGGDRGGNNVATVSSRLWFGSGTFLTRHDDQLPSLSGVHGLKDFLCSAHLLESFDGRIYTYWSVLKSKFVHQRTQEDEHYRENPSNHELLTVRGGDCRASKKMFGGLLPPYWTIFALALVFSVCWRLYGLFYPVHRDLETIKLWWQSDDKSRRCHGRGH